jgi:hypothetical protein
MFFVVENEDGSGELCAEGWGLVAAAFDCQAEEASASGFRPNGGFFYQQV